MNKMINKVILILSVIATAQCQYPAIPQQYTRHCGAPAMPTTPIIPTRPTCTNIPTSLPIPNIAPPCAKSLPINILNSPYELPIPPKTPLLPNLELPISLATPPKNLKSPYELALPIGLESAVPKFDIPRNPFLPAASPVSALAPFLQSLPPANSCSRCQYLKKIPIPPPCI